MTDAEREALLQNAEAMAENLMSRVPHGDLVNTQIVVAQAIRDLVAVLRADAQGRGA